MSIIPSRTGDLRRPFRLAPTDLLCAVFIALFAVAVLVMPTLGQSPGTAPAPVAPAASPVTEPCPPATPAPPATPTPAPQSLAPRPDGHANADPGAHAAPQPVPGATARR